MMSYFVQKFLVLIDKSCYFTYSFYNITFFAICKFFNLPDVHVVAKLDRRPRAAFFLIRGTLYPIEHE